MVATTARAVGEEVLDHYPLTPLQHGMLFQWLQAPGSGLDVEQAVGRLREPVDAARLERSWARVTARHAVLRTRFRWADVPEPVQEVLARGSAPIARHDCADLTPDEREARLRRFLEEDRARGFDLTEAPPTRLALLRFAADEYVLVWSFHHILAGGASVAGLLREVFTLYDAGDDTAPDPPVSRPFRDHVFWLRARDGEADEAYWTERLGGMEAPPPLSVIRAAPRDPEAESPFGACEVRLPAETEDALRRFKEKHGVNRNVVAQAAWALLLGRYTGRDEAMFGLVRGGRTGGVEGAESIVGLLVNTVPTRVALPPDLPVLDWLRRLADDNAALRRHEHAALADVRRWSGLPADASLFDTTFTYHVEFFEDGVRDLGGVPGRRFRMHRRTGLPVSIAVAGAAPMRVQVDYDADRFDADAARRLAGHFVRLVGEIALRPQARLAELRMVGAEEREALLAAGRARQAFPVGERISDRFARRAAERPDAVALCFGGERLAYRELDARANRLANHLVSLGAGPETRVAIRLDRSAELVVAILGVLKAGAAYVPLDPAYPPERTGFVLEDADAPLLVTRSDLLSGIPPHHARTVCLDTEAGAVAAASADAPRVDAAPGSLAYVIYTSGSTGKPKGVRVTHANVLRLLDATDGWFGFGPDDVWTLFHSFAFDFSVWEMWGALLYGGRLVVVPHLVTRSPEDFHRLLVDEGVTVLNQTPSAFRLLAQADLASNAASDALRLRRIVFGGEALEPRWLRAWMERHGDERPRLVNMYGITETTVHVTYREITRADLERAGSPIGVPIPDLSLHLLDGALEPVPAGVPGELFVGGAGVARGYLNRPELTAERFVRDPFSSEPGARLYRTGDVARRRPDGELEYLGRADQQVKIRGFRIEVGEIEAVLAAHAGVAGAAVVPREEAGGEKRLVAYVVAAPGTRAPAAAELRAHAAAALPDYMVPAAFVALDALPLTENGKLDRRALPAPEDAHSAVPAEEFAEPSAPAEIALAQAWSEVLGVERVGLDDNYFALGGDSIRSVRVVAAARRRGLAISIPLLFRHQTVRALAAQSRPDGEAGTGAPAAGETGPAPFALLDAEARSGLPGDVEDAYPASQVQLAMLYHTERDPHSRVYLNLNGYRVHARWDEAAMREALQRVAARHPLLRASFDLAARPEPVLRVHRAVEIALEVRDLRGAGPEALDAAFEALKGPVFEWSRPPLLRFHVHRVSDEAFRIILAEHHAVLDGWSVASLMTELLRVFAALRDGAPDPVDAPPAARFSEFVALEREAMASAAIAAFWRGVVDGAPLAALPPRAGDDPPRTREAGAWWIDVSDEGAAALRRTAARAEVPLKTVLLAAHLRVVALLSGRDDVVSGYVTNGRPETQDGERVLGVFLNTLPLRVRVGGGTWGGLLRRAWRAEQEVVAHRRYPLSRIVAEAGGRTPFEAAFNFNHFHVYDALSAAGVRLEGDAFFSKTEVPLTANAVLVPSTGRLRVRLEYDPARLGEAQVREIGEWYARAIERAAADPDTLLSRLPLVDEAAREALLAPGRATARVGVSERIERRFERRAAERPGAMAVTAGEESLTYAELDASANRLGRRLAALGVGPETRVGIALERGAALVTAMVAVLKAGGAYVPLDPAYPAERIAWTLRDADATVLVTDAEIEARLEDLPCPALRVDADAAAIAAERAEAPDAAGPPQALAYVIYTSGSTGRPKGVGVTHANVLRLFDATAEELGFGAGDAWSLFHSAAFDFSVWEIWGALLFGGRVVVVPWEVSRDPAAFRALLARERVTVLSQTPSAFRSLAGADESAPEPLEHLRLVVFGGEALRFESLRPWLDRYGPRRPRLVNMYGITETTVHVTWHTVTGRELRDRAAGSLVGTPLPDLHAYVLDPGGDPVLAGVAGELYVGGAGVARGYLGRPALTAERFVPDPFSGEPGARLYRSGDLARWRADAALEYLGRIDQQVKVRGFRIEPGEIESALLAHPAVAAAAVAVRGEGDQAALAAYFVPRGQPPTAAALRDALRERLPEHLVPAAFVAMDRLPLTLNGKLDTRALPAPDAADAARPEARVVPRTQVEELVAGIWAEVLGAARVGVTDDFFALGGHSILAVRVTSRVCAALGVDLPVRALFDGPTVAELSARAAELRRAGIPPAPPVARADRARPLPLSFAQERLWFLHRMEPESAAYNVPAALRLSGSIDVPALERALGEIVRRHEVLRTTLVEAGGSPVQAIAPFAGFELPVEELAAPGEAARRAAEEAARPFDLAAEPPFRARLLRLAPDEHVLLLCMHHVATDGWSTGVLVRELSALYAAFRDGREPALPEPPVQYADFAVWQRERLRGETLDRLLAWWTARLAGAPALLELPTDHPRPAVATGRGGRERALYPAALLERLRTLARSEGATLHMVLLAAWQALLARYCGSDDVVVGSPAAGRGRAEVEELVGLFVNTLVLRADLGGNPGFREVVRRAREATLSAYDHQDVPFERLVAELRPERSRSHSPLFQVLFTLRDDDAPPSLPGARAAWMEGHADAVKFDLGLSLAEEADGLRATLSYSADLFEPETARRMLGHLHRLLEAVADDPGRRVDDLDLLLPAERLQLLEAWSPAAAPPPAGLCIHHLFEAQAARTPDAAAVVHGGETVTYRELDARANRLAHHLAARGAGPEAVVAIVAERRPDTVVALLAALKAGAAFLPLDPAYPADRLRYMLADSGARLLVVSGAPPAALDPVGLPAVVALRAEADEIAARPPHPPRVAVDPPNLAYVIYTSGSTGRPKGVAVPHHGVPSLAGWVHGRLGQRADDRVLQFASLSFDAAVHEIVPALLAGATLVMADPEALAPGDALRATLRRERITFVTLPPSVLAVMDPAEAAGLRVVVSAGEALPPDVAARWAGAVELHNGYGPTETTVAAASARVVADGRPPSIGAPIENARACVLDAAGRLVPPGLPGELYVGGAGVARGYLGRPGLTAERFVPDPFGAEPGARLYRTGDRARWRADGALDYLGRLDGQVKVRGFRIEPGEVRAALRLHPRVRDCAVVAREDVPGERRLAAYVVGDVDADALRAHLRATLPEYMVPSAFVALDRLPLTPSGKLDGGALPPPVPAGSGRRLEPETELEARVAGIWGELLGVETVGVEDSFFDLGGHSLLLARLQSRLAREMGSGLTVVELFQYPTVRAITARLRGAAGSAEVDEERGAERRAGLGRLGARRRREA